MKENKTIIIIIIIITTKGDDEIPFKVVRGPRGHRGS